MYAAKYSDGTMSRTEILLELLSVDAEILDEKTRKSTLIDKNTLENLREKYFIFILSFSMLLYSGIKFTYTNREENRDECIRDAVIRNFFLVTRNCSNSNHCLGMPKIS
ncbi:MULTISPECIES: hypothetical protein [Cohnella]|uniref:hypothetical protein n=1 Tax=Cohnella TaxID=329857 RepID=UPI00111B5979|nr:MULTISPECIES: hypothetical protein [Cohnella]MBN2981167.1 hypothetical protein [Cohnella algarum]